MDTLRTKHFRAEVFVLYSKTYNTGRNTVISVCPRLQSLDSAQMSN